MSVSFSATYVQFVAELLETFPEYASQLNAAKEDPKARENFLAVWKTHTNNIAVQNDSIFTEAGLELVPGFSMTKKLWSELSNNSRTAIWRYLTSLLLIAAAFDGAEKTDGIWDISGFEHDMEEMMKRLKSGEDNGMKDIFEKLAKMAEGFGMKDISGAFGGAGGAEPKFKIPERLFKGHIAKIAEEIVGEFCRELPDVLISSKAGNVRSNRRRDASRNHLLSALDASLRRLRRSHIDVWHIHAWDPYTPLDETLAAAAHAIDSGKVRYLGVSNYSGWQLTSAALGSKYPIISAQMEYSLLQRGIEREVIPAATDLGIGIMAWSPLGRGVLTGKYRKGIPSDSRGAAPHFAKHIEPYLDNRSTRIVEAVAVAAEGLGYSPLEVALAWVRDAPGVTSSLIGARTGAQLRGVLKSEEIALPEIVRNALNDVSA
jgi:aryl-alcohol dehydrogenase-like predicted oxidoreductase